MIKAIDDITILDFDKIERTGKIGHLRMWYNFLPAFMFAKTVQKRLEGILLLLKQHRNSELEAELNIQEMEFQLALQIEVNKLRAIEMLLVSLLGHRPLLMRLKDMVRSRRLRKIDVKSDRLKWAIVQAEAMTGKTIKTLDDIIEFKEHVKFRFDRLQSFIEKKNTDKQSDTDKKMLLMDLAQYITMYLGASQIGIENMKVIHFAGLYQKAVDKMNQEKKQAEKYGRNQ